LLRSFFTPEPFRFLRAVGSAPLAAPRFRLTEMSVLGHSRTPLRRQGCPLTPKADSGRAHPSENLAVSLRVRALVVRRFGSAKRSLAQRGSAKERRPHRRPIRHSSAGAFARIYQLSRLQRGFFINPLRAHMERLRPRSRTQSRNAHPTTPRRPFEEGGLERLHDVIGGMLIGQVTWGAVLLAVWFALK
jgi:hypothetical protein